MRLSSKLHACVPVWQPDPAGAPAWLWSPELGEGDCAGTPDTLLEQHTLLEPELRDIDGSTCTENQVLCWVLGEQRGMEPGPHSWDFTVWVVDGNGKLDK